MQESEVVDGIEHLGLEADYDTNWTSSLGIFSPSPDIVAVVMDEDLHFFYQYGMGVMAFTLCSNDNTLMKIEVVALSSSRSERNWWPRTPVVMMGEDE
jgi:hypothetical protein